MSPTNQKSIFHFDSAADYFLHLKNHFPGRKRALSLTQFANLLGYKSPRSVAMVLNGFRLPSLEMVEKVSELIGSTDSEKRYFELLVHKAQAEKKGKLTTQISKKIKQYQVAERKKSTFDLEAQNYTQNWYYRVIYLLISAPEFIEDPAWISKELKNKVSASEVTQALQTLLSLGLIERNQQGRLVDTRRGEILVTLADVQSEVARVNHRQNIQRALDAMEEDDIKERLIVSCGLRMRSDRHEEARKTLREFYTKFMDQFIDEENGDLIYQLNLQFFKHTKGQKRVQK